MICETGDCGQQEFRDQSGSCVLCKQCGPGMELSKVTVGCVGQSYACVFYLYLFAYLLGRLRSWLWHAGSFAAV